MQAVILAAGKSTRGYPLTLSVPKPLLRAANKSIIENTLDQLAGLVDEAIIIIGYMGDKIKEKIGDRYKKIKITYIEQKTQDGSGGAILLAKDLLKDRFIVINGDDFYSKKDIESCLKHKYCILAKEVEDIRRFGEVITQIEKVSEIKEKPIEERKGKANTGVYVFDKNIFKYTLEKSQRGELEITDYIKRLIDDKKEVNFVLVSGCWMPIAYPWDLLDANEYMVKSKAAKNLGTIEKGATLKGKVSVGKNTTIRSGSYIEGPVVIGENCTIGPNCFIRPYTTIGNKSKVGNAVEIKNSIIGDNTSIGHLSYVGDSIIGNNVNFGAGTITANLRHDDCGVKSMVKGCLVDSGRRKLGAIIGDNVHTGIHTSIYPGRKIWKDMTTLPGEIVKEDIQ
jgi:UDP-N-acetylglucosamine diphosphorylase / glucose-1-phosphate thymidylyltransferase / UDP-N-acetylgalactosamine diphosphorylase / glucosamine-1-phosphate N-acetyltransferase / galactosamine-1-phosphate N-acetyltransferase